MGRACSIFCSRDKASSGFLSGFSRIHLIFRLAVFRAAARLVYRCFFHVYVISYSALFVHSSVCYDDVEATLCYLKSAGAKIGALTDVAYGMDNSFSLQDIVTIYHYFDLVLTSVDVGYRKPNATGFSMLLKAFDSSPSQMIYVGDEQKDIVGANSIGIISVLIDRNNTSPNWGQKHTIHSLLDIPKFI